VTRLPRCVGPLNAFVDECRRRGAFVAGHPLQGEHTATTVGVRDGRTLIADGPFLETHEHLGGLYASTAATSTKLSSWPRSARVVHFGGDFAGVGAQDSADVLDQASFERDR
jgi:hypothetical protein